MRIVLVAWLFAVQAAFAAPEIDYQAAIWHPLHFKPAIETATNEQCLACHQEILDSRVKSESPAGVKASEALAWYQTLSVYEGEQETFHRRHLVTPKAQELMNLKCSTCHEGHSSREEAPIPPTSTDAGFTLRKAVNPETTCLKCHGQMDYQQMGLPSPWEQSQPMFQSCMTCHAAIRTTRHQVNYLNAEAIEKAGQANSDSCYGCHGGRAWYRISYPYPRHAWPGMAATIPEWAKNRPTESAARFQLPKAAE
jgi:nitrate/TMAO reductase-like tetraheme cytochrome c subunit